MVKVQCPECDGGKAFSDCTLCQGTGRCSKLQADESTARDQELNDPLAPPVEDMLVFEYGAMQLHFRRRDGHWVITRGRCSTYGGDPAVYEPDALDEACNAFAGRAGCDPVVVLNEAVRLTEGA